MTFPFDETLILENEIALLKPLEKADLAALLPVALSDRNLLQYSPQPIYTEALLSRYIDQALQDRASAMPLPSLINDRAPMRAAPAF